MPLVLAPVEWHLNSPQLTHRLQAAQPPASCRCLQELGELLDIHTLPTFSLVKGGVEVHRVEGVPQQRPARALSLALRKHLLGEAVGDQ